MNRKTIEKAARKYGRENQATPAKDSELEKGFIAGAHYVLDRLCHLPWNEAIKELTIYADEKKGDDQ